MAHTIIRIEHADGYGMYRAKNWGERYTLGDCENTEKMNELHANRKTPYSDGIKFDNDMFCAFESLETFKALVIDSELSWLLHNHDFKVLMLDVTLIHRGEHQVCYKKEHVLQTKDISSFFK